jgi:hypothetical protein
MLSISRFILVEHAFWHGNKRIIFLLDLHIKASMCQIPVNAYKIISLSHVDVYLRNLDH